MPLELAGREQFSLLLEDADFRTAETMAQVINKEAGVGRLLMLSTADGWS